MGQKSKSAVGGQRVIKIHILITRKMIVGENFFFDFPPPKNSILRRFRVIIGNPNPRIFQHCILNAEGHSSLENIVQFSDTILFCIPTLG